MFASETPRGAILLSFCIDSSMLFIVLPSHVKRASNWKGFDVTCTPPLSCHVAEGLLSPSSVSRVSLHARLPFFSQIFRKSDKATCTPCSPTVTLLSPSARYILFTNPLALLLFILLFFMTLSFLPILEHSYFFIYNYLKISISLSLSTVMPRYTLPTNQSSYEKFFRNRSQFFFPLLFCLFYFCLCHDQERMDITANYADIICDPTE